MKVHENKKSWTADEAYQSAKQQGYNHPEKHPYVKGMYQNERDAQEIEHARRTGSAVMQRVLIDNVVLDLDEALSVRKS